MSRNSEPLGFSYAFRDLLIAMLVGFMALAVLALLASKPIKPTVQPGTIMVQIYWEPKVDADVDLWVKAPGDRPVGYSNQNGKYCNLLRDDLGRSEDSQSRNFELTVCRATPNGEYVINAHMFSSHDQIFPINLRMTVSVGAPPEQIIDVHGRLDYQGQEITLARFSLKDGHLVPNSINSLYMALRNAQ